jgi:cytochrome c oxidase subunit 4
MTEHAAESHHDEHDAHDSHDSPENIRKEMTRYIGVFLALAALTGLTVWVRFSLQLPEHQAIIVALIIATVKGSLVAAFFMHLLSEKLIYSVLIVTVLFFGVLMWLPVHDVLDKFGYK